MFSLVARNISKSRKKATKLRLDDFMYSFVHVFRKEDLDTASRKDNPKVYVPISTLQNTLRNSHKNFLSREKELELLRKLSHYDFHITACDMKLFVYNPTTTGAIVIEMPNGTVPRIRVNIGVNNPDSRELVCLV